MTVKISKANCSRCGHSLNLHNIKDGYFICDENMECMACH